MSAQTEGRDPNLVSKEAIPVQCPTPLSLAAGVVIYGGSLVFVNSSGYAVALSPDQTMSCAGFAENEVDNSAGGNGDKTITPRIGCISLVNGDAIVAADVGKMAYASDNQTARLSSNGGTRCAIGPILGLDGSRVFVGAGFPLGREVAGFSAVSGAPVLTSTATGLFSAEVNLGALSDGLVAVDVTAGVAAFTNRSIAVSGAGLSVANADGQAGNPTLSLANGVAALEALAGTGLVAHTAADTYAERTIASTSAGLVVTNGDGVAGNPSLALDSEIQAIADLSGTGIVVHTGAGTMTERSIGVGSAALTVTNGTGVGGNVSLDGSVSLKALSALAGTGFIAQTAGAADNGTFAERSITSGVGLDITNPAGVAGNPLISLSDVFVRCATINATGGAGGSQVGSLTLTLTDVDGNAIASAKQVLVIAGLGQYAGMAENMITTITYSAASAGSIIASGNGWCLAKTDATGVFTCALNDTADETAYFTVVTAQGVSLIADICLVVGSITDSATWSA